MSENNTEREKVAERASQVAYIQEIEAELRIVQVKHEATVEECAHARNQAIWEKQLRIDAEKALERAHNSIKEIEQLKSELSRMHDIAEQWRRSSEGYAVAYVREKKQRVAMAKKLKEKPTREKQTPLHREQLATHLL